MPICQNKIAVTSIHISKYDIKYSNQSLFSLLFFKILRNIFSYLIVGFKLTDNSVPAGDNFFGLVHNLLVENTYKGEKTKQNKNVKGR